ncbi:hypothetical protein LOK49_LG05G02133 [Camellia lanceoleosa]|uniref:Uncharacterized protein n=1 Tax=Camellia lanceoleosa TaxID=1840588 RepID=A0ACC0HJN4_9ERIC|nr:hypothetical protein LOK49_LG05G02133 [Camellia lanceoleosa]
MIHANKFFVFGIIDTKVSKVDILIVLKHSLPVDWSYLNNIDTGNVTRIIFTWNTLAWDAIALVIHEQVITCRSIHKESSDFNVVRHAGERLDANRLELGAVSAFNSCLEDIGIEELTSWGFWFTWSNQRGGGGNIRSKLDRVLVNSVWRDKYPESEALLSHPGISEHCPISIGILSKQRVRRPF